MYVRSYIVVKVNNKWVGSKMGGLVGQEERWFIGHYDYHSWLEKPLVYRMDNEVIWIIYNF